MVNALDANGNPYNFSTISGNVYENRNDTRDALKDLMDDTYETPAENESERRPKLGGKTLKTNCNRWLWNCF
jgi:hypothetical protein